MRVLYYGMGGGLGHVVRARAVLHTLGLTATATLLTASPHARDARVVGDLEVLPAPAALAHDADAWRAWLLAQLRARQPEVLCVDAFPAGILGELCDLPDVGCMLWHVARLLRWPAYAPLLRGAPPPYTRVLRVEPFAPAQQAWFDAQGMACEDVALRDPPAAAGAGDVDSPAPLYWLIVHSGPADEVAELVAYADEARAIERADVQLLVVTAQPPANLPARTRILDAFPASAYFADAARIFSAAGFNVVRQAAPFRAKHVLLPLPRRFDDQFERAARVRRETANALPIPDPPRA